jgi:hypothetical protein
VASEEHKGWAGAHKKLVAVIATATAIVGLTTGVLALSDRFFPDDDEPAPGPTAAEGKLIPATAAELSDGLQLTRFEQLLGAPTTRKRLRNDEWLVSTWDSPDIAVSAFSNRDSQVVAYTLTSLGPDYTPLVDHVRGGVRLRDSVFADLPDKPTQVAGVFPPNGRFFYSELYVGGGATGGKSVVLSASFAANAGDRAVTELSGLGDCMPLSIFAEARGCTPERVSALRRGMHVTSMTVGEAPALEALSRDGASFFPDPGAGS